MTASETSSDACAPKMWTPRISSVSSSETTLTNPSVSPAAMARPEAANGNVPARHDDARLVELGLGSADPRDLRMGVDHPRHGAVVDPALAARDALRDRDPVLRSTVGEHGPRRAVADRPDAIAIRAAEIVHPHEPSLVPLDACLVESELFGYGPASDRDHEPVHLEPVRTRRILVVDDHRFVARLAAGDPLAEADVKALSAEDPERLFRDVAVRGGKEVFERLDQHDLGAEPAPDAPELEADDPGPDDREARGRLREGEGALGVHDALPVRRGRGDGGRHRAGGEDHVAGVERPRRGARHLDRAVPGQAGGPGDELDAVLLQ